MKNLLIKHNLLQQNLILHKSCFDTANIMQNRMAMQWQPKILKECKYHNPMWFWRKVPWSSKSSICRKMKTNIIQAQQLSISYKSQSLKSQPWKEDPMHILFLFWFVELVPVSLNDSCSLKRRTVICGTCGVKHHKKTSCWNILVITSYLIIVNDLCRNYLFYKLRLSYLYWAKPVVYLEIIVYSIFSSFENCCRVFSNFRLAKTFFRLTAIFGVYWFSSCIY